MPRTYLSMYLRVAEKVFPANDLLIPNSENAVFGETVSPCFDVVRVHVEGTS